MKFTFDGFLEEFFKTPGGQQMVKAEMEQIERGMAIWNKWFPPREPQPPTEDEINSARQRIADDDYPTTEFGAWLREHDREMVGGGK